MSNHVVEAIDAALDDWEVSGDAMRWAPGVEPSERDRPTSLSHMATVNVSIDISDMQRAFRQMVEALANATAPLIAAFQAIGAATAPAKSAPHGPKPLSIDGHAYNRRRKARKGRR